MRCDIKGTDGFYEGMDCGINDVDTTNRKNTNYVSDTNTELTDWQDNFVKGYLLGMFGIAVQKYKIKLNVISNIHYSSYSSKANYGYVQGDTSSRLNLAYILLNGNKEKINGVGAVLSDNDITYYAYGGRTFNLPAGEYYYREIRSNYTNPKDVKFTVVESTELQQITINQEPNLVKMEYTIDEVTMEDLIPDATNYIKPPCTTWDYNGDQFAYGYDKTLPIAFQSRVYFEPCFKFGFDINHITVGSFDLTNYFSGNWEYFSFYLGNSWIGMPPIFNFAVGEETTGEVYTSQDGSQKRDTFTIYGSHMLDVSNINTLRKYNFECLEDGTAFESIIDNYVTICGVRNDLDFTFNTIRSTYAGYVTTKTRLFGSAYKNRIEEYYVEKTKNTHYNVVATKFKSSEVAEEQYIEWHHWDKTKDFNQTVFSEGKVTEWDETKKFEGTPYNAFTRIFDFVYGKVKNMLIQQGFIMSDEKPIVFWYYETADGVIEACSSYTTRYTAGLMGTNNPTVADEDIVKSYIAAPIFFDQIKEGYEHYFS